MPDPGTYTPGSLRYFCDGLTRNRFPIVRRPIKTPSRRVLIENLAAIRCSPIRTFAGTRARVSLPPLVLILQTPMIGPNLSMEASFTPIRDQTAPVSSFALKRFHLPSLSRRIRTYSNRPRVFIFLPCKTYKYIQIKYQYKFTSTSY